jgi:hypothetical protein
LLPPSSADRDHRDGATAAVTLRIFSHVAGAPADLDCNCFRLFETDFELERDARIAERAWKMVFEESAHVSCSDGVSWGGCHSSHGLRKSFRPSEVEAARAYRQVVVERDTSFDTVDLTVRYIWDLADLKVAFPSLRSGPLNEWIRLSGVSACCVVALSPSLCRPARRRRASRWRSPTARRRRRGPPPSHSDGGDLLRRRRLLTLDPDSRAAAVPQRW